MSYTSTHKQRGARGHGALLLAAVLALGAHRSNAQSVADLFDRADNNTVGNGWTEMESTAPTSTALVSGQLVMRSNAAGIDQVSRLTTGNYNTVLSANGCLLSWSFNMRQTRNDPTGFDPGGFGAAVVLGATHADLREGTGYAVVLGTPGSTIDGLRLVRYTGGLDANANVHQMVTVGDMNDAFIDVRVTYDPSTGLWSLYYAASASGPYGDASAVTNLGGSAIDNTLIGTDLPYIGALWNHGASSVDRCRFDNLKVPFNCATRVEFESSSFTAIGGGGNLSVPLTIANPDGTINTQVDIVLISGNVARLSNFDGTGFTFNSPTETTKSLVLTLLEEGGCAGDEQLVFELQNISGGQGPAYIGPGSTFTLTITDEEVTTRTMLEESFETDGSGDRYTLDAPHAAPLPDTYFQRGTAADFITLGGVVVSGADGSSFIGGENMGTIAANAAASITFTGIDILGASGINVGIMAAARNAAVYDRSSAGGDYIQLETNVDGAGWTLIGAFRPDGPAGSSNKRMAVDTDLDGQGDGTPMTNAMTAYTFPTGISGSRMDLRIRFRSTATGEELYFDKVQVSGTQCRPVYYANGSGSTTDPIWSTMRSGEVMSIDVERNVSLVVQNGFTVTAGEAAFDVRNITVETGGTLDGDTAEVTLYGDRLHNDGTFSSSGQVIIAGEEALVVTGVVPFELTDVTVNATAGATMNGKWNITGTLQLNAGDLDATLGDLVLRSNALVTGRMGPVSPGATYTGKLKMERYIPGGNTNWRLLGSPVGGTKVQHFQDDFYTAGYPGSHVPGFLGNNGQPWPSVRWYDETDPGPEQNDGMMGVTSNNQSLVAGQGFAAWSGDNFSETAPFIVDLRGTPNIANTPITLPMTWTDTGNPAVDGYNLVSNPLPSAIDFNAISLGADVDPGYSIFDPATGNTASWNGITGVNGANGIIQSTQGFWLKAHGPDVTTSVTEAAKVPDNSGGVFGGKSVMNIVRLRVGSSINQFSDETVVLFHVGTPDYTDEDVPKFVFAHPAAPQIATAVVNGQWIAINAFGPYSTDITIPVIVNVAITGSYTITANEVDNTGLSCIRIEDLVTGISTPIYQGAAYTFTMAANDDPNAVRFLLHATAPLLIDAVKPTCAGEDDGSASMVLYNGPADVIWTDAQGSIILEQPAVGPGTASINSLLSGDHGVRIEGLAGCADLESAFSIEEPLPLALDLQMMEATCPGAVDGGLFATVSGGTAPYAFAWSNGATTADPMVGAGTYNLLVTDSTGCVLEGGPYTVSASETPVAIASASMDPAQVGYPVIFSSAGSEGEGFAWDFGDGTTSYDPDVVHIYTLPGTYTARLAVTQGPCTAEALINVTVETATGVVHIGGSGANAWLSNDRIIVEHSFDNTSPVLIEVLNSAGQLHATRFTTGAPARVEIPTNELTAGLWFVRVTNNEVRRTFVLPITEH